MPLPSRATTTELTCPLCGGAVAVGSSGCRPCHLPMTDVVRHSGRRQRSAGHGVMVRLVGLLTYAGVVAWAWYQLPQTLPFVVPAAIVGGGYFHVLRGRPWLGLVVFAVIVVVVPVLVWPALGTGTFSDLTEDLARD